MVVAGGSLDEPSAAARLRGTERDAAVESGLYEQATGGTLYLAGLEDFVPAVQRMLVADLDAGGYVRVGGRQPLPLGARFVSIARPGFENRRRRRGVPARPARAPQPRHAQVPPLRDYAEDVPELLRYYVDRLVDEERLPFRRFGVAAQNRLRNYPWPGNMARAPEPRAPPAAARRRGGDPARGDRARARDPAAARRAAA